MLLQHSLFLGARLQWPSYSYNQIPNLVLLQGQVTNKNPCLALNSLANSHKGPSIQCHFSSMPLAELLNLNPELVTVIGRLAPATAPECSVGSFDLSASSRQVQRVRARCIYYYGLIFPFRWQTGNYISRMMPYSRSRAMPRTPCSGKPLVQQMGASL